MDGMPHRGTSRSGLSMVTGRQSRSPDRRARRGAAGSVVAWLGERLFNLGRGGGGSNEVGCRDDVGARRRRPLDRHWSCTCGQQVGKMLFWVCAKPILLGLSLSLFSWGCPLWAFYGGLDVCLCLSEDPGGQGEILRFLCF
ncbi:hypothetical protein RchiOBHm_Chr2g0161761 [Rosa chinensis]|uniref:Uncharacterized protein n=1 Tax=Rosa chinensis TaxID=74649 RepID=A0A2P6S2U2_ROSCH|nr:hypothetical protein RchiOBHm_Chr2g0161761 [Rosa chinensis]